MSPASCQAWILLSVPDEPAGLDRIMGMADAINRAIPSQDELNLSLGFLQGAGLVVKKQNQYCLAASGSKLIAQARATGGSIFDVWKRLESQLSGLLNIQHAPDNLSAIDVSTAYDIYRKRLRQEYARLIGQGEA